jgi:hypothetical protein
VVTTIAEFAAQHGVEYSVAAGFIKFLVAKGIVKENGMKPSDNGKGQGSKLFLFPEKASLDLKPVAVPA